MEISVEYLYMNSNGQNFEPIKTSHEDIMHEVFDQSTEGFQVIDTKWRYVFVNNTVAKQGKKTKEELIGHTMMEMYPGIENTPLFIQLKKVMNDKISIRMENEFEYPDKSKGWFELFVHPWSDGIMIFSVDITARKQAQQLLEEKIANIEKVVPQTPEIAETVKELKDALKKMQELLSVTIN